MKDFDWSTVEHAYGAASDVPQLLEQLRSGDDEQIDRALYQLNGNIWHQGTVYEATAYAVPGLVQAATQAGLPRRGEVLYLIKRIYFGQSYNKQHEQYETEERRNSEEYQQQMAIELRHVAAAKAAVDAARESLLGLLDDDDPDVRIATVSLACGLSGDDRVSRLEARLAREPDPLVRSVLVAALSIVSPTYPREKLEPLLDDESWLVRREAAVNLGFLLKGDAPPKVVDVLLACTLRASELEDDYARSPFRSRGVAFDSCGDLSRLATVIPGVLDQLVAAIDGAEPAVALQLMETVAWRSVNDQQGAPLRAALRAWLRNEDNWSLPNVREGLVALELPHERDALLAALLRSPTGSVDDYRAAARAASSARLLDHELEVGTQRRSVADWWVEASQPERDESLVTALLAAIVAALGADGATQVMWHATQLSGLHKHAGDNARALLREAVVADAEAARRVLLGRAQELVEFGAPRRQARPGVVSISTQLYGHVLSGLVELAERGHAIGPRGEALVDACRRQRLVPELVARYDAIPST